MEIKRSHRRTQARLWLCNWNFLGSLLMFYISEIKCRYTLLRIRNISIYCSKLLLYVDFLAVILYYDICCKIECFVYDAVLYPWERRGRLGWRKRKRSN